MKSSIKRLLIIFLVLITFSCAMLFGACSCDSCNDEEPVVPLPSEEVYGTEGFRFVTATNQLLVGEEYVVPIDFVYEDGVAVVFSSSDSAIATIDEKGKISAIKPGKTTILGVYGEAKDKFDLEVTTEGYLPTLEFESNLQPANYVTKGASLNVKPVVHFNGREFTDFTVEYSLSTPAFGTVDSQTHTFTAGNDKGKNTLTVKASWRDIESPFLTKTIDIEVVNEFIVAIDGGTIDTIEVYTFSLNGEITEFADVKNRIKATYDGEACPFTLAVENNESEISTDDNPHEAVIWDETNITAKYSGKAKLKVTVTTEDGDKPFYIDVVCKRPIKDVGIIEYFETDIGEIPGFASYIPSGADTTIVRVLQDGRTLKVENNRLLDVSRKTVNAMSVENVIVYTKDIEYRFALEAYTRVIDDGNDLQGLWWSQSVIDGGKSISNSSERQEYWKANAKKGYYFVKNDIRDATPYAVNPYYDSSTGYTSLFAGTFDGNGKVIEYSIAENSKNGLFGDITLYAVIKNASFVVKAVKDIDASDGEVITTDNGIALARKIKADGYYDKPRPVIRNVYVGYDVEFTPTGELNVGVSSDSIYARYENVVIDMSSVQGVKDLLEKDTEKQRTYSVFDNYYGKDTPLTDSISQTNVFVISDVPYLKYKTTNGELDSIYVAKNDGELLENVEAKLEQTFGAHRFTNYNDAINYFKADENKELLQAFGEHINVNAGFPYGGNMKNLVNRVSIVEINGEENYEIVFDIADEGDNAKKTINLTYFGEVQEFTVAETLDSSDIISVSGKEVIYNTSKAGAAKLTINATIVGETYKKEIFVRVNGIEALAGTVYYDGEGATIALLPSSLTSLAGYDINDLTIISANAISIIEDGQAKLKTNATNTMDVYENAYVYLDGVVKGRVTVNSVTKIITTASDLTSVYVSSIPSENDTSAEILAYLRNNPVKGYYFVANDIVYDEDVQLSPYYHGTYEYSSVFQGVFDGNGKTVEYDLLNSNAGLFGEILGNDAESPIIKNVKFVVKDVSSSNNYMLARKIHSSSYYTKCYPLIQNVYVGYDKEFTPTTNNLQVGVCETGIYANYENVIVDMSKVKGVKDALASDTEFKRIYSVFDSGYPKWGTGSIIPAAGNFKNSIVISDVPQIKYITYGGELEITVYAKSEGITASGTNHVYPNLSRFDDYMALKAYFNANPELLNTFNFTDTSMGFPFVGDKEAYFKSKTVVKDGETAVEKITFTKGERAEKTISLSFLGESIAPTVTSSNTSVINTAGNKVIYDGGFDSGITLTVSVNKYGVQYEKTLNVEFAGIAALGTVYIDADRIYTENLSGEYTTLNVKAIDDTALITEGEKQVSNATNSLVTYENAYVYDGEDIKGIANVIVVKKIIDEASDLTSLYLANDDAGYAASDAHIKQSDYQDIPDGLTALQQYYADVAPLRLAYLFDNIVNGYYLVIKDIPYQSSVHISPLNDATFGYYSIFQGVFDGNGKTIEYDLLNSTVGLFGEIMGSADEGKGAVIKNAKFVVKDVTPTGYNYILARKVASPGYYDKGYPLIQNVYLGYGKEFTPTDSNFGVGVCQTGIYVDYENVIVDMSKVNGIKAAIDEDATNSRVYGIFDSSASYATSAAGGDFSNTIVISDVPYIKYRKQSGGALTTVYAANEGVTASGSTFVYSHLNRYNDYTALKEYLDDNPTVSGAFANIIDAIEFPSASE